MIAVSRPATLLLHVVLAAAVLGFGATYWILPVENLSTQLLGAGYGDNVGFLWDFWWMRKALSSDLDFFYSPYLLVPYGAKLVLHTHVALPAFVGASIMRNLSTVAALNMSVAAAVFLNGLVAWLLAYRITRHGAAALFGGLVFAASPYISAHLQGHFNLVHAWVIPLFGLAACEACKRHSLGLWACCGVVMGLTAYVDYYYVVFEAVLLACLCLPMFATGTFLLTRPTRRRSIAARVIGSLLLVDVVALCAIGLTGGFDTSVLGVRVSAHGLYNPLQIFWLLLGVWALLHFGPQVAVRLKRERTFKSCVVALLVLSSVFVVTAGPVLGHGVAVLVNGDYATEQSAWRSAPEGIDLATVLLGNPFHRVWGAPIQRLEEALGIDVIESSAWLGVPSLALAIWASFALNRQPMVRMWSLTGAVFFIWALGPHLMFFGVNTGLTLPQAFIRYLPIVSNARIPGRAMVVVYLAVGILSAVGLAELCRRSRKPFVVASALLLLLFADFAPAEAPTVWLPRPAVYATLRDRPEQGAVCELPLGVRDGFGVIGTLDHRVLFYQTLHERPLVGGFVARLSPRVRAAYERDPLFSSLLRLSGGASGAGVTTPPAREQVASLLSQHGIRFIVLNRQTASAELGEYVENTMPVDLIAEDGGLALFVVK